MSNSTGDLVTRIYSNFRGVDFRGEEINLTRSPDSLNMWKNYKATESIETRPSLTQKYPYTHPVYGIFAYKGSLMIHTGTTLRQRNDSGETVIYSNLAQNPSQAFIYEDVFYIKDGQSYLQYDGETIKEVEGYIPTTTIARKPTGGGTKYEDVNMLSAYRKNSFLSDGVSFSYFLDVMNIDSDFVPEVTVNDEVVAQSEYTVDYTEGKIVFKTSPPDAPLTAGQDNVIIKFKKAVPKYKDTIMKTTLLQVFDNRVFFSGNDEYPNMLWHCSLNDPSYVSDLDYYKEGMDTAKIKGLVAGNNALWVFREPSSANTTVFYHTPALDDDYGKIYPSSHSSITTGCIGKAINFNDDIVFFSERGMEGISGDVTTEQAVAHRSTMVDSKMTSEFAYEDMVLAEWEGYLFVFIGNMAYLADSRARFTNQDHLEYEWFYWDIGKPVHCAAVNDGLLYIGSNDGVYVFDGQDEEIESYWTTPKDKFKYPHKLKTTNKRGCVAEATGDISVYAKLEDTDFELIGTYNNVTDYFVSRIKRKKFKDIQLKFYSPTRFSLETVTLEAFIGGYIKR